MKNENTRTIAVPSSPAMSAMRRIRSSSGPIGAPIGIFPMGEPIADTRIPAASSAARKAATCASVKSATLTDHAPRSSRWEMPSAASVASCSAGSGEISSANPLSVTVMGLG
jgi:hypothetical protein